MLFNAKQTHVSLSSLSYTHSLIGIGKTHFERKKAVDDVKLDQKEIDQHRSDLKKFVNKTLRTNELRSPDVKRVIRQIDKVKDTKSFLEARDAVSQIIEKQYKREIGQAIKVDIKKILAKPDPELAAEVDQIKNEVFTDGTAAKSVPIDDYSIDDLMSIQAQVKEIRKAGIENIKATKQKIKEDNQVRVEDGVEKLSLKKEKKAIKTSREARKKQSKAASPIRTLSISHANPETIAVSLDLLHCAIIFSRTFHRLVKSQLHRDV